MMRPRRFYLSLLVFLALTLPLSLTQASWRSFAASAGIIAVDFYGAHRGLIVRLGGANNPVQTFQDSTFTGVFSGSVDQVAIQDSDRAWGWDNRNHILYKAHDNWATWTQASLVLPYATLVGATPTALFLYSQGDLLYTTSGEVAIKPEGIPHGDSIRAIDYYSDSALIAVSSTTIYGSSDGGVTWKSLFSSMNGCVSVFVDRVHGWAYTGSDQLRKSTDRGKTWNTIPPPPPLILTAMSGPIFGVHDCTGTLLVEGNSIYRTRDGGISFEVAGDYDPIHGPVIHKAWAFNRGSVIYLWNGVPGLGSSISVSFDGMDGLLPDSVRPYLSVSSPTSFDTLCSPHAASIPITVRSSTCSPVALDSIKALKLTGRIVPLAAQVILSQSSATLSVDYSSGTPGIDSLLLRIYFHAVGENIPEFKDFNANVVVYAAPARLAVADSLDFGKVTVNTKKELTLRLANLGCSPLRIDSVRSSNPTVYALDRLTDNVLVPHDSAVQIAVTYQPSQPGTTVESIELWTNAGHRFVELLGTGSIESQVARDATMELGVFPTPASHTVWVTGARPGSAYELCDVVGRVTLRGMFTASDEELRVSALPGGIYMLWSEGSRYRIVISRP